MKKYLAKVTLVASITLLFSFSLNVQAAHAFGWLSPQWFNQYFSNNQSQQQKQTQTQTQTLSKHRLNNLQLLLILSQALLSLLLNPVV